MKLIHTILAVSLLTLSACTDKQVRDSLATVTERLDMKPSRPTTEEVIQGLKQALEVGIVNSADIASTLDGYYNNPRISIPFPPDARRAADKLRELGFERDVDRFVKTLNRGAESAAAEAAPIFVDAIRAMSIEDAWSILKGDNSAATDYLRARTSVQLRAAFQPVMANALQRVDATRYYGDIVKTYNRIPLVEKVNPDLNDYATEKAIDGLFVLVAAEESKIRQDPLKRTTDLLRKVFGELDRE